MKIAELEKAKGKPDADAIKAAEVAGWAAGHKAGKAEALAELGRKLATLRRSMETSRGLLVWSRS